MGHTATLIGAVALASGLICLLCGFLWGRSNLRSQVEDAVDLVRRSADAREFDLREQLDQKMLELSQFRAQAEGRPRSQKQAEQVNASTASDAATESGNMRKRPAPKQEPPPPQIDQTEKTIQNLLKSMEERLKQPEEAVIAQEILNPPAPKPLAAPPPAVAQQSPRPAAPQSSPEPSQVVTQKSATPAPPKLPATQPAFATQATTRPSSAKQPATSQRQAVKDEWQEFAASLEALRRQSK